MKTEYKIRATYGPKSEIKRVDAINDTEAVYGALFQILDLAAVADPAQYELWRFGKIELFNPAGKVIYEMASN